MDRCDLSAVILAGGRSSRMGRPKAWLPLGGVTLLQHVIERVRPLVNEIVVVAALGQALPIVDDEPTTQRARTPARANRLRVARDRLPAHGPLAALALGLATIETSHALALACDAPFVLPAVLDLLARADGAFDAVVPLWDDRPQPLIARYAKSLAPTLDALVAAGERRLQAITELPRVRLLTPSEIRTVDSAGISFRTLNTPAEYEAALRSWPSV